MTILMFMGIPAAVVIWWFWYKKISFDLYCLTGGPRLNIAGKGFRIWKSLTWYSTEVQLKPLELLFHGWKIGRKKGSKIQVCPDDSAGFTREDYHYTSRIYAILKFDFEKAQFYLENLGKIRWKPLECNEAVPQVLEEKRLYIDRNMKVYFGPLFLEIKLSQKEPYNADACFNAGICIAFFAYQIYATCLLFWFLPVYSVRAKLTICVPVFLLAIAAYALFMNSRERHPIQTVFMAILTILYFIYIGRADNAVASAHTVCLLIPYGIIALSVAQGWGQIRSKRNVFVIFLITVTVIFLIQQISVDDIGIGDITQIITSLIALLVNKTDSQNPIP